MIFFRVGTFDSQKSILHRSRQSVRRNPSTLKELDFEDLRDSLDLPTGENFVIHDTGRDDSERIVIFGSHKGLEVVSKCNQWHLDGSFNATPLPFFHLLTVLGLFLEQVFPLIFALLPNRHARTYEKFFQILLDLFRARRLTLPSPLLVISDFESGLLSSIRVSLPSATHRGCYIHYSQCIYHNVKTLGFSARYKNDQEFRIKIRMFIALGLVPLQWSDFYAHNLFTYVRHDRDLLLFYTDYFFPTWLRPDFPRSLINWYCVDYRTNAGAFYSRLSKRFRANHTIFRFSLELFKCHISDLNSIDLRLLGHPPSPPDKIYRRLNYQSLAIQANFATYPDPISYLRQLAHFTPTPYFNM